MTGPIDRQRSETVRPMETGSDRIETDIRSMRDMPSTPSSAADPDWTHHHYL